MQVSEGRTFPIEGTAGGKAPRQTRLAVRPQCVGLPPFPSSSVLSSALLVVDCLLCCLARDLLAVFFKEMLLPAEPDSHGKHVMLW